jgi:hypothetical protein
LQPTLAEDFAAHDTGGHCPTFLGYIFKYSLPILLPILALSGRIFL